MAESIVGTPIKQLPEAAQSQLNDSTDLIVEDATPTTRRTKLSTLANWIKAKLGIGTASSLQTTSKEIVGAINELSSSLELQTGEKSASTYLPKLLLYKDHKTVHFRCAGYTQQDIQANQDYQFGTLPDGFWPIAGVLKYEKYTQGKECRIDIPATDGRPIIRFFEDVPAETGVNINIMYVAK